MRNIINISLPEGLSRLVKKEVKKGNFASTSEFFRHLLRLWNNHIVAKEIEESERDFELGKFKEWRSLKDLM